MKENYLKVSILKTRTPATQLDGDGVWKRYQRKDIQSFRPLDINLIRFSTVESWALTLNQKTFSRSFGKVFLKKYRDVVNTSITLPENYNLNIKQWTMMGSEIRCQANKSRKVKSKYNETHISVVGSLILI